MKHRHSNGEHSQISAKTGLRGGKLYENICVQELLVLTDHR